MQTAARATGKDIILDIVENMRAYREELLYSSVVPTSFEVHLSYGSGEQESLSFFIVPEDAPTIVRPSTSTLGPVFGGEQR